MADEATSTTEPAQQCGNCRFHVASTGECRRFPPQAGPYGFPVTLVTDFCGEWQQGEDHVVANEGTPLAAEEASSEMPS